MGFVFVDHSSNCGHSVFGKQCVASVSIFALRAGYLPGPMDLLVYLFFFGSVDIMLEWCHVKDLRIYKPFITYVYIFISSDKLWPQSRSSFINVRVLWTRFCNYYFPKLFALCAYSYLHLDPIVLIGKYILFPLE